MELETTARKLVESRLLKWGAKAEASGLNFGEDFTEYVYRNLRGMPIGMIDDIFETLPVAKSEDK